jgi:glycogen synthase
MKNRTANTSRSREKSNKQDQQSDLNGESKMKNVKHVLMTADTIGGVWTYCLELAKALEPQGVQVSLATMGARMSPAQRSEANKIANLDLYESSFKLEWMPEPWDDVQQAGDWLLHLEELLQPDVVHLNGYCHASLPWRSPKLVVCHSCVLSWWQAVKYDRAPFEWMCYEDEVTRGLKEADLVVAPTQAMLDAAVMLYGDLPQTRVIYNARDPRQFRTGEKEEFVFTVGRLWDEAKNVAALEVAAHTLPWPVYAAGETAHPDGGDTEHQHVHGLGRLSPTELADWYSRAAIYALPARYEPFGLSALEAALSGCALVLGDIPSLREVWGPAAVYVDPESPEALRQAIQNLIDHEAVRNAMADQARKRAQEFSPERLASEYMKAYADLAGAAAGRPKAQLR